MSDVKGTGPVEDGQVEAIVAMVISLDEDRRKELWATVAADACLDELQSDCA